MATVQKFEDLICWQRAQELVRFIYTITKNENFSKDWGLKDQIQRAAVSVMSNIAEGFDRGTKAELINFFYISKGSCGEVKCQLYVAFDCQYIDDKEFQQGMGLCDETARLIRSFVIKVKGGAVAGSQFKHIPQANKLKEFARNYMDPEVLKKYYSED